MKGEQNKMPSYSQRERRECPKCQKLCKSSVCVNCGSRTQIVSRWTVRFKIKENDKIINKRLSGFGTQEQAQKAYENYVKSIDKNINLTFKNAFEQYVKEMSHSLKGATIYSKINVFNLHILPYFASYPINNISKENILEWRTQVMNKISFKTNKPYSVQYLNNMRAELNSFMNYVQEHYSIENVIMKIKPLKRNSELVKEMRVYTFAEFKKLLHQINLSKNEKMRVLYNAFFSTLYYSGARVGEVLALKDEDLDFAHNVMNINKSLTRKTLNADKYKITSPKNATSIRKIIMPLALVNILQEYLKWKREHQLSSQFLFGGDTPLNSYSYTTALRKFSTLAGIKCIRIHDFRHSHASLLINLGANVTLVSKRLGHKNTQQTLNTYSHLFPTSEREIIKLLNRLNV